MKSSWSVYSTHYRSTDQPWRATGVLVEKMPRLKMEIYLNLKFNLSLKKQKQKKNKYVECYVQDSEGFDNQNEKLFISKSSNSSSTHEKAANVDVTLLVQQLQ